MAQADSAHITGASSLSPRAVMTRAWVIFRQQYNYPAIPFRSIGRPCFAWALKSAWAEAEAAAQNVARLAVMSSEAKADRIADIERRLALLPYRADFRRAERERRELEIQLTSLAA